jgi:cytochrome c peroxidase
MRAWGGALVAVTLALGAGCTDDTLIDGRWRQSEWDYLTTFRRTPLYEPDLPGTPMQVALGRRVFFDTTYSDVANQTSSRVSVSCATCHKPPWFVDDSPSSLGVTWTGRNTIALVDIAYRDGGFAWDGKFATAALVLDLPVTGPMASTEDALASAIVAQYPDLYVDAFGAVPYVMPGMPDAATICTNVGEAIAAYEARFTTGLSPFDLYVGGDLEAIGERAKHGLELFIGDALCSECHDGPQFSDGEYHNTGVPQVGDHARPVDHGRGGLDGVCPDPDVPCAFDGAFRTPSLRNVDRTAPYMHAGQLATLDDVVSFYWHGGGGDGQYAGTKDTDLVHSLELDETDRADLVAFLATLTGNQVDEDWYTP